MRTEQSRIRAFTLSEMLVVLMITSLLVGLSYSVLQLIQKQMWGMEAEYETKTDRNRLQQALWLDMNQCDRAFVHTNPNRIVLSTPKEQLNYLIMEDMIIRQQDTFYIGNYERQFYFENRIITAGEIDAILLNLKPQSQNTRYEVRISEPQTPNSKLFIYKSNSATTYMNN